MGLTIIGYETVARIHSVQLCPMLRYSEHRNEPSAASQECLCSMGLVNDHCHTSLNN